MMRLIVRLFLFVLIHSKMIYGFYFTTKARSIYSKIHLKKLIRRLSTVKENYEKIRTILTIEFRKTSFELIAQANNSKKSMNLLKALNSLLII